MEGVQGYSDRDKGGRAATLAGYQRQSWSGAPSLNPSLHSHTHSLTLLLVWHALIVVLPIHTPAHTHTHAHAHAHTHTHTVCMVSSDDFDVESRTHDNNMYM